MSLLDLWRRGGGQIANCLDSIEVSKSSVFQEAVSLIRFMESSDLSLPNEASMVVNQIRQTAYSPDVFVH
jgi:hypothetical protein